MKYRCGMYGGSFNPLHIGHVRCIIRAANMCERLIIVISNGRKRCEADIRVRYRWVYELTRHLPDVRIFILEDDCGTKAEYGEAQWFTDAEKVKAFAGEKIDAVFCGSDYDENSFWNVCYPDAELVIFPRDGIILHGNTKGYLRSLGLAADKCAALLRQKSPAYRQRKHRKIHAYAKSCHALQYQFHGRGRA